MDAVLSWFCGNASDLTVRVYEYIALPLPQGTSSSFKDSKLKTSKSFISGWGKDEAAIERRKKKEPILKMLAGVSINITLLLPLRQQKK